MWQKQEKQRQAEDAEAKSVMLQPIQDHKAQRIKNKLSHCLNKAVRVLTGSICIIRSGIFFFFFSSCVVEGFEMSMYKPRRIVVWDDREWENRHLEYCCIDTVLARRRYLLPMRAALYGEVFFVLDKHRAIVGVGFSRGGMKQATTKKRPSFNHPRTRTEACFLAMCYVNLQTFGYRSPTQRAVRA